MAQTEQKTFLQRFSQIAISTGLTIAAIFTALWIPDQLGQTKRGNGRKVEAAPEKNPEQPETITPTQPDTVIEAPAEERKEIIPASKAQFMDETANEMKKILGPNYHVWSYPEENLIGFSVPIAKNDFLIGGEVRELLGNTFKGVRADPTFNIPDKTASIAVKIPFDENVGYDNSQFLENLDFEKFQLDRLFGFGEQKKSQGRER